jgi:hypothetical protein
MIGFSSATFECEIEICMFVVGTLILIKLQNSFDFVDTARKFVDPSQKF